MGSIDHRILPLKVGKKLLEVVVDTIAVEAGTHRPSSQSEGRRSPWEVLVELRQPGYGYGKRGLLPLPIVVGSR